ncbi:MAG: ATP-binding protein [Terriglobia bacterium]|jgi:ATP-dependent DNA helicase RecG
MPEVHELERLISDLESDRVERKQSLSDPGRIRQAICAYANDLPDHRAPGYIFIGVNDAGIPVDLPITDQLLLTLSDMRSDGNILPLPYMNVEKVTLKGVPVAVVEVHPSDMPPVRLRGQVWIRVGPRRAIATRQEERVLTERQIAGSRTFDHRPCLDATLDDLLVESFRAEYLPRVVEADVIAQNNRSVEEQLASLRFFDLRKHTPTYAGVLVFGKDPLNFMPGAFIQFVRFDGMTLADSVQDEKSISGNLLTQLLQIDNLLPLQIRAARVSAGGLRHGEVSDYPLVAVRELTLNAVMHRAYEATNAPVRISWFEDRIEIQNPGGLYGQVTPENYERVSDYRNPVIAEVLKALGYVERFGTGITRANSALKANNNPPAEFTFEATHVLVTIRRPA